MVAQPSKIRVEKKKGTKSQIGDELKDQSSLLQDESHLDDDN